MRETMKELMEFLKKAKENRERCIDYPSEYDQGAIDTYEEIIDYLKQHSECQHFWIKLSPIKVPQDYLCLNCDIIKKG